MFMMPKAVTISGRSSSLTNAFVNGIIPCIEPTDDEIESALEVLGQKKESVTCVYCGDKATEWDHLNPLIMNKKATGFISEIKNLVPACGKCNQSKGNKKWKNWILSDAKLSPKTRGIKDIEHRIEVIERYEDKYHPRVIKFEEIVGADLWNKHWENHEELLRSLKKMQEISDKIKEKIKEAVI